MICFLYVWFLGGIGGGMIMKKMFFVFFLGGLLFVGCGMVGFGLGCVNVGVDVGDVGLEQVVILIIIFEKCDDKGVCIFQK